MQRMIVMTAPHGSAFMFAPGATGVWLRYDSANEEVITNWLRDLVMEHEELVRRYNVAQAAQELLDHQAREAATVAPPGPKKPIVNVAAATLKKVVSMTEHDWNTGAYKIGAECTKCGVQADGFEPSKCAPKT